MKTYTKPQQEEIILNMASMIAFSFNGDTGSDTLKDEDAEGDGLTRRRGGIGSGLWEDMK